MLKAAIIICNKKFVEFFDLFKLRIIADFCYFLVYLVNVKREKIDPLAEKLAAVVFV